MNVIARSKLTSKLGADEMERRREALEHALANSRIEGQFPSSASREIFEAFVRGEIEFDDVLPRLRAIHQLRA